MARTTARGTLRGRPSERATHTHRRHRARLWAVGLAVVLAAGACDGKTSSSSPTTTAAPTTKSAPTTKAGGGTGVNADGTLDPARCAQNKAAGHILYLSGFDYAASASILDVVVADQLGYFKKMCLDVELRAGLSTDNVPLVSAGRAQVTSLGSAGEVAGANANGAKLVAVVQYANTAIDELLVPADSPIQDLKQLEGTTMGIKGAIPYSIRLMLAQAGVDESKIKQVTVGFDPTVISQGRIQSLPVYKSSEPHQLDAQGIKYRAFDPRQRNVPGSFGLLVTSQSFAHDHPTAVEDFVRADLAGFAYAKDHPQEAVGFAVSRLDPKNHLSADSENYRWGVESKLALDSTPAGQPVGAMTQQEWQREIQPLVDLKVVPGDKVDVASLFDPSFVQRVHKPGTATLVWPA